MTTVTRPASLDAGSSTNLRTAGRWCLVAGVIGAIQAAVVLAWPHQVPEARFSFPFTATGHVIAQSTFFLQHVPLVVAVVSLARLPRVRDSKATRVGLTVAAVGLGLLALMEVVAMAGATTAAKSHLGSLLGGLYGLPMLLIGVGLTVAGATLLRSGALRAIAWFLALLGVWLFVVMTPALASGSFVAGRIAIGSWLLLFAGLGLCMMRSGRPVGP